jgi:hypothetical protein
MGKALIALSRCAAMAVAINRAFLFFSSTIRAFPVPANTFCS